jgi:23S rRNA (uracil1939-C5)-methyltransferase
MRKRERVILESVEIENIAAEGKSIAHVNGKVLFVPFAIPGDIVDVLVTGKRKSFMEGTVVRMIKPSSMRIDPFCSHYGVCGGCKWQPLPYQKQLEFKQQQVEDQLVRIGKLDLSEISPILGSQKQQYYRNKLEFTFSDKRWVESLNEAENLSDQEKLGLGFHIMGMFDKVLDVKKCYLQEEPSNKIRLFIKDYAIKNNISFFNLREQTGLLRNMVVRTTTTNEVMLIIVFSSDEPEIIENLMNSVAEQFPEITSLNYVINSKKNDTITDLDVVKFKGNEAIYEKMENLKFKIGPKSFFQTNSEQAYQLYSVVRDFADLKGDEVVYDLYTGTGTIALFLASGAAKVVGVEYVPEAIEDAFVNASENNISNCTFYAGDMKDMLNKSFIEKNGHPDVIILDPPRAGIHPDVAKVIVEARPSKIVYVSCNPATQARDIALMSEFYQITRVQPVDMFPHTHHLENVVKLELKS